MSPEQARGQKLDVRSDIFSAGLLLHALLVGLSPWGEGDDEQSLLRVRSGRIDLTGFDPPEVEPLLARALDPSAGERFPTAGAFADALEELAYAKGWRGGSAALRDRLVDAFPDERERLNSLFDPAVRQEGLQVAREGTDEGTLLSRIPEDGPVAPELAPKRQTVVAELPSRSSMRLLPVLGGGILGVAILAGTWFALRPSTAATDMSVIPVLAAVDAAAPVLVAEPGPDASAQVALTEPTPPPPPPVAPKPEKIAMGTLTVNANPWGTVSVNGRPAGTTPLFKHPVRAGPATVLIENPKLGRRSIAVKILPGRDTPLIVDLRSPAEAK